MKPVEKVQEGNCPRAMLWTNLFRKILLIEHLTIRNHYDSSNQKCVIYCTFDRFFSTLAHLRQTSFVETKLAKGKKPTDTLTPIFSFLKYFSYHIRYGISFHPKTCKYIKRYNSIHTSWQLVSSCTQVVWVIPARKLVSFNVNVWSLWRKPKGRNH